MSISSELQQGFARRERRALAQILTQVELGRAGSPPAPAAAPDSKNRCLVVGLTGSGGAGKSTLIAALIRYLRSQNLRVAVMASDPQSPLTGGALLGDRVRVAFDPKDEGVYFRSLSTRGAAGGLSSATEGSIPWLKAFGFDVILIETVGVGQDQVHVRNFVDRLVLLVTPNSGDEIQWEKAGVIEVADVVVVNKADLPAADRAQHQLTAALSLGSTHREVPVLPVVATTSRGVPELWAAIANAR